MDDSGLRLFQPRSNMADCLLHGERSIENTSAGHDSKKAEKNHPWQRNRLSGGKRPLPPRARLTVIGGVRVVRVNEEIDIGNDHRLPISDSERAGTIYFELVDELIQLRQINAGAKSAWLWMDSKTRHAPRRRCSSSKTVTQRFVHDLLE